MTRPLYCDANSFGYLSDERTYQSFMNKLEKSKSKAAHDLLSAFTAEKFIKHPIAFIELFGSKQKIIHQKLEKKIPLLHSSVKKVIDPFLKDFKRSDKKKKLGKGLDDAIDLLYDGIFALLWNDDDLSLASLQARINSQRKGNENPSQLFLHMYNFIKENLNEIFRENLIHDLSIEALYRYGGRLISKLYTGNKALGCIWFDHLSAICFGLWEKRSNYSAYRLIGEELELLNRKYNLGFFPAKKLRPHDDTLDGYIIHALSFGWFYAMQKLTSVSLLSGDPFDETFDRVQQYQTFIAYAQNPLDNKVGATAKIRHEVLPGTLYSLNPQEQSLKLVSFYPARILKGDLNPQIQHSHSEIEVISFK